MFNIFKISLLAILLFFPTAIMAEEAKQEYIGLTIPASVLSQVISEIVPIQIDTDSNNLTGTITIVSIDNLQLADQKLSSNISLAGRDLHIVTELAGHEIRMKVGNIDLDFKCDAEVRFDEPTQTLFVRPVVADLASDGAEHVADIGQMLITLLNGREFPIEMSTLEPIVAKMSNKTVIVDTHLAGVKITKHGLQLGLLPIVSTK